MFRLPPQPLLTPAGYRIPIRGRAPDVMPPVPVASRLGHPGGAAGGGRGKGRGKGRQRQRNKNKSKGANKKAAAQNQPAKKVEVEKPVQVTEESTEEVKDDITDENWQIISEETGDSPQQNTENYVDFQSDMFDTSSAKGFSTFSDPVLVISDEPEVAAAAPTEEVITDIPTEESTVDDETVTKDVIVVTDNDNPADESQEIKIVCDDDDSFLALEVKADTESTPAREPAKVAEKPSPNIVAITAPASSSSETKKKKLNENQYCKVCNVHCPQQSNMDQHLAGRRHRMNVAAQESRKKAAGKQNGGSGKGKEAEKSYKHFKAENKYKAYIKTAVTCQGLSDAMQELFKHKEPLIGLKYGIEVGKSMDDPNPVYHCSICDEYFNSNIKLKHFGGTAHRKAVVRAEFPHKFSDLPRNADEENIYRNVAQEIENENGRQVHLLRRKVVTTDTVPRPGEPSPKRSSDRTVKALLDLPPRDYLLENPGHEYKGQLLEPHDRVVRVVPPSLKRDRDVSTWSPPPPAKRRSLLDPHEHFPADDINYRNFEGPPELLSGPFPRLDVGPTRPPLMPPREESMDSRIFRQGLGPPNPKPLLSLDLPPVMPPGIPGPPGLPGPHGLLGPRGPSLGPPRPSFGEQLRRMFDTMDSLPIEELIRNEEDASIALRISNGLTKALLSFRMHTTPNVDRTELGSVYSMFSGGRL